ncbi:hypothetical protein P775_18725 [Puniceibacterium antarcticum]|uniref:Uncharacterized protein n=1 Tax=Puniceibacterium antarcticum TaxID=1206336 RepID=A0A2G8RAP2_9RHOB|nr:hypothetical protein P775_18725 [Puniceibacterium antarcticum]
MLNKTCEHLAIGRFGAYFWGWAAVPGWPATRL